MISVTQAAEMLGVSRQRVLQLIRRGQLKATKVGNVYVVERASVQSRIDNPPNPWRPKAEHDGLAERFTWSVKDL